jgi:flagellar motor switch protein FliN
MTAEALSQNEIDALLRGETPPPPAASITPEEEDTIKEYTQTVSNASQDVLSTLLGEAANTTVGEFSETDSNSVSDEISGDLVVAELNYKGMVQGKSIVIMSEENAMKLAAQMTGGGAGSDFGDLEESAFSEAIQSVFSSANTSMANKFGGEIQLDPPEIVTRPANLGDLMPESAERSILLTYNMESGAVNGPIYQIIPRNLLGSIINASSAGPAAPGEGADDRTPIQAKTPPIMAAPAQFAPVAGQSMDMQAAVAPSVDISNLDLILDISLEVTVELGRTHRKIRDVLELGPGSVIELDRLANEPVDILVNDKLFAKGEVVVIDENFGVRITDILSIEERIEAIK